MLTRILTYHVVAGKMSVDDIKKQIKAGNGTATFKTVDGPMLTATMMNGHVVIKDEKGDSAMITIKNVYQSNGVIQVVDTVLQPGS